MAPIVAGADVDRPPEEVFAYVTDPTRFREWQHGVVEGHMDGDDPLAVGAKCVTVRRIGGRNQASTSELVRSAPPRSWRVRGIDGPIRAAVEVRVEPLGTGRSRVEIAVDFTGHGIGKLLVPLVVRREAQRRCRQTWPGSSSGSNSTRAAAWSGRAACRSATTRGIPPCRADYRWRGGGTGGRCDGRDRAAGSCRTCRR